MMLKQLGIQAIKTDFKKSSFLLMASLFIVNISFSNASFAQGIAAGTDISNKVIVNYSIGSAIQTPIESSPNGNSAPGIGNGEATVFKVDRKVDLSTTSNGNTNVILGTPQAELSFTLTNEGNDSQEFKLALNSTLSTDDFDSSNCFSTVTAVTGSPLPGVVLPTTGNITLKADQQASISVKCDIPQLNNGLPILTGQTSLVSLLAIAEKNTDGTPTTETSSADTASIVDTVFADNNGTDDNNRDASHSARGSYIALDSTTPPPPTVSMNKSILTVQDPQGGNTAISGSEVTYKIIITTAGTGLIENLVITDPTPLEMTYKNSSIILDNNNLTDINDADNATFDSQNKVATINLGNITAGTQHEIQLTYIIN